MVTGRKFGEVTYFVTLDMWCVTYLSRHTQTETLPHFIALRGVK